MRFEGQALFRAKKALRSTRLISAAGRSRANTFMYYVYFLRSLKNPKKTYVGFTENIDQRLAEHNAGKNP